MPKTIRIYFLHKTIVTLEETVKYLNLDAQKYNFIWDTENPDYLFVSEHIYLKKRIYKKFLSLIKTGTISIYCAGECIEPDLNLFDYAIVFDRNLRSGDRIARIPAMYFHKASVLENKNTIHTIEEARKELKTKKGFCNFLYSNGRAHPIRDQLFYAISAYKNVDSLGGHLRNVDNIAGKLGGYDWAAGGISINKHYRFSIASENATYEGYVTEKLLTSFQAHTVPIYWGDPGVKKEFNEKAFIYVNELSSLDEVVEKIKQVEENEELWCSMIAEPWQTEEQVERQEKEMAEYQLFLAYIFDQDKEKAIRRAQGTYPEEYRKWYRQRFHMAPDEIMYRVRRKLQKHS